jgi:nucleoid DNA-binding protein
MTKEDIATIVAKTANIKKGVAENSIDVILKCMKQGLNKNGSLTIRKFGYFSTKNKRERSGRNPKTGEPAVITARRVVTFSPSKTLKQEVNK